MRATCDEESQGRCEALRRIRRRLRLLPLSTLESLGAELEELAAEGELDPLAAVLTVRGAVRGCTRRKASTGAGV